MKNYDEEAVLTHYIWNHYHHLLNEDEQLIAHAMFWREKAQSSSEKSRDFILKKKGEVDNPIVQKALEHGHEFYRRQVSRQLLQEHEDEIFINRCPKCQRIVGTPKARQCKWCFHSWHDL